jgi:hypothetical protein
MREFKERQEVVKPFFIRRRPQLLIYPLRRGSTLFSIHHFTSRSLTKEEARLKIRACRIALVGRQGERLAESMWLEAE